MYATRGSTRMRSGFDERVGGLGRVWLPVMR